METQSLLHYIQDQHINDEYFFRLKMINMIYHFLKLCYIKSKYSINYELDTFTFDEDNITLTDKTILLNRYKQKINYTTKTKNSFSTSIPR